MKKNTFYSLLFCATLGSCAVLEGIGSNSQEIAEAQSQSVETLYRESETAKTDAEIFNEIKKENPELTPEEIEDLMFNTKN